MTSIYSDSKDTLVWLGSGDRIDVEMLRPLALNHEDLPTHVQISHMEIKTRMADMNLTARTGINFQRVRNDSSLRVMATELKNNTAQALELIPAYAKVLSLPWLGRTWVLQEFFLSQKRPFVIYGGVMLEWSSILVSSPVQDSLLRMTNHSRNVSQVMRLPLTRHFGMV
jgi:hypothetical protein